MRRNSKGFKRQAIAFYLLLTFGILLFVELISAEIIADEVSSLGLISGIFVELGWIGIAAGVKTFAGLFWLPFFAAYYTYLELKNSRDNSATLKSGFSELISFVKKNKKNILVILITIAVIAGTAVYFKSVETREECFHKEGVRIINSARSQGLLSSDNTNYELWDRNDPVQFTAVAKDIFQQSRESDIKPSLRNAFIAAFAKCKIELR